VIFQYRHQQELEAMHTKQEQELQMFIQHMNQRSEQISSIEVLKAVMDGRLPSQTQQPCGQLPRTVPLHVISTTHLESAPVAGVASTGSSSVCLEALHMINVGLPALSDGASISVQLSCTIDHQGFAGPTASKFRPVSPGSSLRRTHSLKDQNRDQVRDDLLAEISPAITLRRKQSADAAAILSGISGDRLASTSEPDEPVSDVAIPLWSQSTADSAEVGAWQPAAATADRSLEQLGEMATAEQRHLDASGLSLPLVSQYQVLRGDNLTQQVIQQAQLAPVNVGAVQDLQNLHHLQSIKEAIGNLAAALSAGSVSVALPGNIIGSVPLPAQMNSFAAAVPAPGQSAVAQGISQVSVSHPQVMSQSVATTVGLPQTILQPAPGMQPAKLSATPLNQSLSQTQASQLVASLAQTVPQGQLSVNRMPSAVPQITQAEAQSLQSQPTTQLAQPLQQAQLLQTVMQAAQPVPQPQLPKTLPQAVPQAQLLSAVPNLSQTAPLGSQTVTQPVPPVTQSMLPQPVQQLPVQTVPQVAHTVTQANVPQVMPQVAQAARPTQLPQGIPQGVPQLTQAVVQPQLAPGVAPPTNMPPVIQPPMMQAAMQQPAHMAVPGVPPLTSTMPQLVGGLSSLMQPTPQQLAAAQLAALGMPPYAVGNPLLFGGIPGLYPSGGVTAQHATPVLTLQQQQILATLPLQQQQMMLQQILMQQQQQSNAQFMMQQQQHLLASQQQALGPQFHMLTGGQALRTPLPSVGVAPHIPSVQPPSVGAAQTQPNVQPVTVTSQASGLLTSVSEVDRTKPTVVDKR
jgi:hypothetical protein